MARPAPKKTTPKASAKPSDADAPVRDAGVADAMPSPEAVAAAFVPVRAFMDDPLFLRVRGFLKRLAPRPPQVLLLEGGTVETRLAAAHYWSFLLNCASAQGEKGKASGAEDGSVARDSAENAGDMTWGEPCLACGNCVRMVTHLHRDCFFLDGVAASIKIDDVREVRAVLGEPPREARCRVVIFREAQALVEAAANALLKSFEDPRPATSFVLTAPQRERLLPTLVSRGMTLTLPWPQAGDTDERAAEAMVPWEAALTTFLTTGTGLFAMTGGKGAVDAPLAHAVLNHCGRILASRLRLADSRADPREGLDSVLARLPRQRLRMLDEVLTECQDSLIHTVNPTLVLEWFATRLYLLVPRP